jgi:hypothetical protein
VTLQGNSLEAEGAGYAAWRGALMRSYHFSFGDSTRGVVGLCARIRAKTKRDAVATLRRALENSVGPFDEIPVRIQERAVEYVNVYIRPENIRELKTKKREGRYPPNERGHNN